MDYIGKKCPVCEKNFHADEDIVVCPDCGTPHHRDCYEAIGHCKNADRHAEGYDYATSDENPDSNVIICRSCGKENIKGSFFCRFCAAPLSHEDEPNRAQSAPFRQQGAPNGMPFAAAQAFNYDPMGGVEADADMGDDVTAGELAKYVKQNTPYFLRVFNKIRTYNRSRFNFCAALFSGGYLLYRKMYKAGALVSALQIAMLGLSAYIQIAYRNVFSSDELGGSLSLFSLMTNGTANIDMKRLFILLLPSLLFMLFIGLSVVIGATANKMYFTHCRHQIVKIKLTLPKDEKADTVLQTKGGVNMPLAISVLVSYSILYYLPVFFTLTL